MMDFVSWADEIPSIWEVGLMKIPTEWENKIHVPNHQPVLYSHVGIAKIPNKLSNIIQLN